ncbi:hypothetical protein NDU88_002829 [Pleurodeles waltl]|uniref:Uncharacterized protein n=1 Tax=Pleurodeles waltl TaxID=8319 RepID=A0AAV7RC44_PLEWA|nr:hypothetical protein NDU88_002829 [Pleurodeles waltl]
MQTSSPGYLGKQSDLCGLRHSRHHGTMERCHCTIEPAGVDSRTPLQCSVLPRSSSPLTSGVGLPGPKGYKRVRDQHLKWRPQLVRSRGSVMYAARPPGCPRCLLPPPVNMGGEPGRR